MATFTAHDLNNYRPLIFCM